MSEVQSAVWLLVRNFKAAMKAISDDEPDISPMEVRVVMAIAGQSGCNANYISRLLQCDKAMVTRLLNDLVKKGLVIRTPDPEDRRILTLALTPDGDGLYQKTREKESQLFAAMLQGVTQKGQAEFIKTVNKMEKNLQALVEE